MKGKINVINLKTWLLQKGIKQIDIAREIELSQPTVNRTINGKLRSEKVVEWIKSAGCPHDILGC